MQQGAADRVGVVGISVFEQDEPGLPWAVGVVFESGQRNQDPLGVHPTRRVSVTLSGIASSILTL